MNNEESNARGIFIYAVQKTTGIGCVSFWKLLQYTNKKMGLGCRDERGISGIAKLSDAERRKIIGLHKSEILGEVMQHWRWEARREAYENLSVQGIRHCTYWDREYPERLKQLPDPPLGLFYIGRLPQEEKHMVAVIGARLCSEYGKYAARVYSMALARAGAGIVSGLAAGIDSIAQKAAVEAGGYSVGVLGSGIDICYPAENREIYDLLGEKGCVVSEYPPGTPPRQQNFPMRNRIISGLSDTVLVMEARERSGTLITADLALEQGKDIYALPGRVTDALSFGCNRLIWQGAGIAVTPALLVECLGLDTNGTGIAAETGIETISDGSEAAGECADWKSPSGTESGGGDLATQILHILDLTPKSMDDIRYELQEKTEREIPMNLLLTTVLRMELAGKVTRNAGYVARKM